MQIVVLEIIWDLVNRQFENANWTWGEMELLQDIAVNIAVPEHLQQDALNTWGNSNPESKKKLIKLICKINNQKIEEEKEQKDIKIDVKSVKILIEKVLGINVSVSFDNKKLNEDNKNV